MVACPFPAPAADAAGDNRSNALDLRLVPFPKSVSVAETGHFPRPLFCEIADFGVDAVHRTLNPELTAAGLPLPAIRRLGSSLPCFRLSAETRAVAWPAAPQQGAPDGYTLEVRPDGIVCANGPAGSVHGLQTLCQLIRADRQQDTLPSDASDDTRRERYFRAHWAVRRMALNNPLLNFDTLLFVKCAPTMFPHMSDQHYA